MFKLINFKTIGAAVITMSLVLGTLAGPVSTAFAMGTFNKSVVIVHDRSSLLHPFRTFRKVNDGGSGRFGQAYKLGNRSIGQGSVGQGSMGTIY